jgi:hypothetical protein
MKMDFKVNVNIAVKVKLTDFGISILKDRHDELNESIKSRGGQGFGEFELKLDEDGYYKTQLWTLMNIFGDAMTMAANEIPFELNMIITNGEPI